jgi:NTP pyrophosphatase (non-canonical NTP hydrolase)
MSDENTTIANLKAAVQDFVARRDWQPFHSPKNLSMSIAIEAAELMEHFQWVAPDAAPATPMEADVHVAVADELADVLIYCLSFSNAAGIDISDEVLKKLRRNEERFPVDLFRGRYRHPQRKKDAGS